MSIDRRKFIKNMGLGIASMSLNAKNISKNPGGSESLLVKDRKQPKPAPKGYDRLPLSWYHTRVQNLKNQLENKQIDAILLESDINKVYFSGCFRGSGERSTWVLFPLNEMQPIFPIVPV